MSEIESTYTCNMDITEDETRTFLAGKNRFIPDKLEIWILDYDI